MLRETGERQVKYYLRDIEKDHRNRYFFAAQLVEEGASVADIGCGVGYGSYYIAMATPCEKVLGIDIDYETIEFAKSKYVTAKNEFICKNIITDKVEQKFDLITAFEVVEHVPDSKTFLEACVSMLQEEGMIILTTPNENVLRYNPEIFKFHQRHYTPEEFKDIIEEVGLEVLGMYSQNDEKIFNTNTNAYNVAICKKKGANVALPKRLEEASTGFEAAAANINRLEWYVKHAPRVNYEVCCQYLADVYSSLAHIEKKIVNDFESHRRRFTPDYFGDNWNCEDVVGPLKPMDIITQTITSKPGNLCGIAVCVATYCDDFKGKLLLILKDLNENIIHVQLFKNGEIRDNEWLEMRFPLIGKKMDITYKIEIRILEIEEKSKIGIYFASGIQSNNMILNEVKQPGRLSYRLLYY